MKQLLAESAQKWENKPTIERNVQWIIENLNKNINSDQHKLKYIDRENLIHKSKKHNIFKKAYGL